MRALLAGKNLPLRLPTFLLATATASRRLPAASSLSVPASPLSTDAAAMKNVVSTEDGASVTPLGSKEFLLANPPGAYTTARTCGGGSRIFEWDAHVERTAASLRSMMEREAPERGVGRPASRLSDPLALRRRLDASVERAVRLHREANDAAGGGNGGGSRELKITALVGWAKTATDGDNGGGDWVACHVTSLPPFPARPVRVEVRGSPRENAAAKDSSWVSDRAPLEALMAGAEVAPINELLLTNERSEILEGSQTNFYAVVDGVVHTAEEGILAGTVRGLVLDVCRREGIPVVLRPPNLNRVDSWQGALLSSTSRLALPIDKLYIPSDGRPSRKADLRMEFENNPNSIASRIQNLVSMEVEARSIPIGDPGPM